MASYTENLNLLKKDPVADGSDTFNIATMLNDNWDKIDAAMEAAKSAEEYNDAGTYAVGSYCTKNGMLYKCTTAITAAEAWTAAHWAETSVGAEIAAVYTVLAAHTGNTSNPHGVTPAQIGAAKTLTLTVNVPTGWTASGGYYYKQVSAAGMLATDNPTADILTSSDNAANKLYQEVLGKVLRIVAGAGTVTLWATEAPTVAFPLQFKVVR